MMSCKNIVCITIGLLLLLVFCADAKARDKSFTDRMLKRLEFDVGLGAGQTFGGQGKFDSTPYFSCGVFIKGFCSAEDQSSSYLDINNALSVGGKAGVLVDGWWGFEFQYFQRKLEVDRQPFQNTGTVPTVVTPTAPFNGQAAIAPKTLRTFGFLLMLHTPPPYALFGVFRPYLGVGFSNNRGKLGVMTTYDKAGNRVGGSLGNGKVNGNGLLLLA
jgi:hypothetical protein